MLTNDPPPSVDRCHCTVGDGTPDPAAMNDADVPGCTVWLLGLVVMSGAWLTCSVRFWLASGLTPLVAVSETGYVLPVPVGVPATVAVPLPLSVNVIPGGRMPDSVMVDTV